MNNYDYQLAQVLCYCDQTNEPPEDGHPLGAPGCTSKIKAGRYSDDWCPNSHRYEYPLCPKCHGTARGTCPECGKYVRVVRNFPPDIPRSLNCLPAPGMAPHKVAGRECAGTGRVPTETTYTVGKEEIAWRAAHKPAA